MAALLGLSVAGCSTPPTSVFQVSSSTGDAEAAAQLISQYRVARGLSPVRADNRLNQAAEFQARAVAEVGELSHGAFASRMASFGVGGFSAENLSAGSRSVDQAVGRWKASPRHDENLLLPQATRIGLARADAPGSRYGRYWALVLAQ
ncbi:MAG TPA: CAP domain-containing protein [Beijerinckiaceae bacterium]